LRRYRCDHIQGHYFSKPLSVPEVEQMLRKEWHFPAPDAGARMARKSIAADLRMIPRYFNRIATGNTGLLHR
jgi:hypothetical protein